MFMNDKEEIVFIFIGIVVAFAMSLAGYALGVSAEQRDAVKLGMAHYVSDERGYAKFEYKKF